ncbi:MAG: TonB-dependent receptor [Tannerella sp.]|jgi:TonB-linked SusC/RagA family outer membrane protein|nr:TonB-dependent receptor [Tannerella sp.]
MNYTLKLITTMVMTLFTSALWASPAYSQNVTLTLNMNNVTVGEVFGEIERNSEYIFISLEGVIDTKQKVSIKADNAPIEDILDKIMSQTGNRYRISGRQIIIINGFDDGINGTTESTAEVQQQKITIRGIVTDGATGETLPGVNIVVKGTSIGIVSNSDGAYTLSVPAGNVTLTFSYIGYITQDVETGNRRTIDVAMREDTQLIEEVVVVGYGVQKKESSVAAISQVKGNELVKMTATNIPNALAGQVAGVSVVQDSGKPGDDVGKIYIRGVSSWNSSDPLVLVDGIERRFNNIDPNEIETLSILKDASATAVFGVRGANGVILITTKRGEKGAVKINSSAEFVIKEPINIIAPMSSYQTGLIMNEAYRNDNNYGSIMSNELLEHYRTQDMPYIYPNTNWQAIMLRDAAFSQKYNVNISGGTDFARVFASVSYLYDGDIIKTEKQPSYDPAYKYNRYNYRFNIDADLTPSTVLSLDAGGNIGIQNAPYETNTQRLYRPLYMLGPMVVPFDYPAEVLQQYPDRVHPEETGARLASTGLANSENPNIANNYSGQRTIKRTDLNATISLKQKLDFITKGLSANVKVAYNHNMAYVREYSYDAIAYHLNPDGSWTRYQGRGNTLDGEGAEKPVNYVGESVSGDPARSWYFEASMNYNRDFGKHGVTAMVVAQRRKSQSNVAFPKFEEGVVGRVTYDFDTRYLMEVNMGYNGSEQFAPQHRYGFFPSYGIGWNLHNEKFFEIFKPFINRAKIKLTHGEVGSDASSSRWLYTSSYINGGINGGSDKYWAGTPSEAGVTLTPVIEENAANSNATWERAVKQQVAFETSFLKNSMFLLNMEFFREHRDQILLDRLSVPAWFGVGMKQQNLGETKTKGYEIELKYQQTSGLWNWWLKPMMGFSDNRIIARDEPLYKPEYQKMAGKRIGTQFGYVSTDMIQNVDHQMNSVRYGAGLMGLGDSQWVDFNGDGVLDNNDQVPIGYSGRYPLYNYSCGAGIKFKNVEFDLLFQGVSHISKVVIDAYAWPLHRLSNHIFEYQLDTWNPENRNALFPAYHFDTNRTHNNIGDGAARTTNIFDGKYIRLKSINVAYTLPKNITDKLQVDNCSVYLRGNNIFTYAPDYPLADPEASDGGGDGRLVYGYYPMLRRFTLGLQLKF